MAARTIWAGAWLLAAVTAVAAATETSEVRASVPDELDAHCLKASHLRRHANPSCSARVDRRISSVPTWERAELYYGTLSSLSARSTARSDRSAYLPYTRADILPDDPYTWDNDFNGGIEHRIDVMAGVIPDTVCAALKDAGGNQTALNGRCEAQELCQLAAIHHGCVRRLDRIRYLHGQMTPEGASRYKTAEQAPDLTETGPLTRSVPESRLLSIRLADQRQAMPSRMIDRDLQMVDDLRELADALKPANDATTAIAARLRDPCAINAFLVTKHVINVNHWRSMAEIDPQLCNGRVATHLGYTLGLDPQEHATPTVKAIRTMHQTCPDLDPDTYYYTSTSHHPLDPPWWDGSGPPDAPAMEESFVHPWDTAIGKESLRTLRSKPTGTWP